MTFDSWTAEPRRIALIRKTTTATTPDQVAVTSPQLTGSPIQNVDANVYLLKYRKWQRVLHPNSQ